MVTVVAFVMTLGVVPASADNGTRGYSFSWFRDADGDGIPNGIDLDWIQPGDGMGYMLRHSVGVVVNVAMTAGGDKVQHKYHLQYQKRIKKPAPDTR